MNSMTFIFTEVEPFFTITGYRCHECPKGGVMSVQMRHDDDVDAVVKYLCHEHLELFCPEAADYLFYDPECTECGGDDAFHDVSCSQYEGELV